MLAWFVRVSVLKKLETVISLYLPRLMFYCYNKHMKIITDNKKGGFNNEILEKWQAGIILTGPEVKSVKSGKINLTGSYVSLIFSEKNKKTEVWLKNCHISAYKKAGYSQQNYEPDIPRKLLLNREEIHYLLGKEKIKGLTILPISVYIKNGLVKLEIALARGLKKFDKREKIKKREIDKRLRQKKDY
jgi:SsrA-binding protein